MLRAKKSCWLSTKRFTANCTASFVGLEGRLLKAPLLPFVQPCLSVRLDPTLVHTCDLSKPVPGRKQGWRIGLP